MFDDIRNAHGERLDATFHEPAAGESHPFALVLGHGVTANKDRPFLVALAEAAAAEGIPTLRFSFAGNGESEGRFEDATITKEVEDLGAVLDAIAEQLPDHRIVYAGHSQGGAVGVLRTSTDARIEALVSLAGMVHVDDFAQRKFGDLEPGNAFLWDKPDCPLSQAYMDDMRQLDTLVSHGERIRVPWLLVHGDADTVVPLRDSQEILAHAPPTTRAALVEIPGADHVFSSEAMLRHMLDVVVPWLRELEDTRPAR
jgi:pimeloyl-ACP methyl ester carboxylesterase